MPDRDSKPPESLRAGLSLDHLSIRDFRCFESVELDLDAGLNLIVGENASGKTSLLEAIFFLSRGRPLRTSRSARLPRDGASGFRLVGRVATVSGAVTLGIKGEGGRTLARVGGEPASGLAQLAETLPVQIIDPDAHKLMEEGPVRRRQFLDWGVFHVEPRFIDTWRRYQRALRQRNAALRAGHGPVLLSGWEEGLALEGDRLDQQRQVYISQLTPHLDACAGELIDAEIALDYQRGWPADLDLASALARSRARDQEQGFTSVGPHRADIVVTMNGVRARGRASRGQQKLLAACALMSQIRHLVAAGMRSPVVLLDDPAAELDRRHLDRFLALATGIGSQVVVTALEVDAVPALRASRRFHVKQGVVSL